MIAHRSTCMVINSDLPVPIHTQSHQLPFQEWWSVHVIYKLLDTTPDHVCRQFETVYQLFTRLSLLQWCLQTRVRQVSHSSLLFNIFLSNWNELWRNLKVVIVQTKCFECHTGRTFHLYMWYFDFVELFVSQEQLSKWLNSSSTDTRQTLTQVLECAVEYW